MGSSAAPPSVNRTLLDAFYRAYASRDVDKLAPLLDDDCTWTINGPVELLHFCGSRRGKQAVLDMVGRLVPEVFKVTGFVPESVLLDGDRAATLSRLSATRVEDGRVISYRVAQFLRFRNGKVVDYRSVIDSFDAAEQVLGRRFECDAHQSAGDDTRVAV
jgi:ketosteroid isomerase-like protein